MKKILSVIISVCFLTGLFICMPTETVQAKKDFSDYTAISTPEELADIVNDTSGKYYLTKDIDMGPYGLWETIDEFSGVLDGNGHKIKNMNISGGCGMFDSVLGTEGLGEIKNLAFLNFSLTTSKGGKFGDVGGIAAIISGGSKIDNCYIDGEIKVNSTSGSLLYVGGIAGYSLFGEITNCTSRVNIDCNMEVKEDVGWVNQGENEYVNESLYGGGIVGGLGCGTVQQCYYDGDMRLRGYARASVNSIHSSSKLEVSSKVYGGGICGLCDSRISDISESSIVDCSYDGNVYAYSYTYCSVSVVSKKRVFFEETRGVGGICGLAQGKTKIMNCLSTGNIKELSNSGSIVGYSEDQFYCYGSVYLVDEKNKINSGKNWIYSGNTNGSQVKKLNVSGIKNKKYYKDWDLKNKWSISSGINKGYPMVQGCDIINVYKIDSPTVNKPAGTYKKGQKITLKASEGATIYYTLNGKKPSTKSLVYTEPIVLNGKKTIRAIAVKKGYKTSEAIKVQYKVK